MNDIRACGSGRLSRQPPIAGLEQRRAVRGPLDEHNASCSGRDFAPPPAGAFIMWTYGWQMGGMWLGWLILLLLFLLVVWAVTAMANPRVPLGGASDLEAVLKGRYARGEIDREEYQRKLEDLRK